MHFDFEAILTLATAVTGIVWLVDLLFFAKKRRAAAEQAGQAPRDPIVVDYSKSFFPVILLVLVLRSFLAEPFHIPSSSMVPTLLEGDFILVNKFTYGIRLPVIHTKLVPIGAPRRGDVVVFHFPSETAAGFCMAQTDCATEELQRSAGTDFIKRVVGLPGDHIVYRDKTLYINGVMMPRQVLGDYTGPDAMGAQLNSEKFGADEHHILGVPDRWSREGEWTVPQGAYFMMGDNRDNSWDSRYWGFVPEQDLVGRAFFIWLNIDFYKDRSMWHRAGTIIH
ncbi:MAG TPA: signal peptidase I [Gammaproteobacteria bacterium]|jgi:signal peptidase I